MVPVINEKTCLKWRNWHKSLGIGGSVSSIFQPTNQFENDPLPIGREFMAGLKGLELIIGKADQNNKRVRAFGSRWSLSNVAFTNEYLVDSGSLDYTKFDLPDNHLTSTYQPKSRYLVFAQSGVMVRRLNEQLHTRGLALSTSGASDGQRIAGAIATGTHGSSHSFGAMTEMVKGIHLVILGRHVFLQRSSDKVVTDEFATWLDGTELINDDQMFNAALVGFGGFGIIHGLLLEVEDEYCLERVVKRYDLDDVRTAITTWDLSGLGLPTNTMPFHLEFDLNPYQTNSGEQGAYIRAYYRVPCPQDLSDLSLASINDPDIHTSMSENSDRDLLIREIGIQLINQILGDDDTLIKNALAIVVGLGLSTSLKTDSVIDPIRIPSKWFTGQHSAKSITNAPVAGTSVELSVPFSFTGQALDLILASMDAYPFAAPIGIRYVKQSSATLGFTGVIGTSGSTSSGEDIVATFELPGPWGNPLFPRTGDGHIALFNAFANSEIPHRYHWGQQFPKNKQWVEDSFTPAKIQEWKTARGNLLSPTDQRMFTNEIMSDIGLAPAQIFSDLGWFCRLRAWFGNYYDEEINDDLVT